MTAKILVTAIGQHIIAGVKSVTERDTEKLVAYWLTEPRLINYISTEEGTQLRLGSTCPVGVTTEYALAESFVVSILDPTEEMAEYYNKEVNPEPVKAAIEQQDYEEVINDNTAVTPVVIEGEE